MTSSLFSITSKISLLAKAGRIYCARKLFDEMPIRDTVTWNAMITGYSHLGFHQEALSLFQDMRIANTRPDHFTITATLATCAWSSDLVCGTKVHALVFVMGYQLYVPVSNALIDMYAKCLSPPSANRVFEEMAVRNEVTWCSLLLAHMVSEQFSIANSVFSMLPTRIEIAWNIMITGYARHGEIVQCFDFFKEMLRNLNQPDQWTLSSLMNACAESLELQYGCMVHAFIIKSGWESSVESKNSILSFYAKLCCQDDAVKMFESSGTLTVVSWNAIIDAYMKSGDVHNAVAVFERVPERNVISWTSMIAGFARNGHGELALSYFANMVRNFILPDDISFGAAFYACSNLAVLRHGQMIHCSLIHHGFQVYLYVGNGLLNMYAKSGDMEGSRLAFHEIIDKDLVSWNAMLFGFAMHGRFSEALQLFGEMVASGTKPDKVTFVGLLMSCSHSGHLEKGQALFNSMESDYGVRPESDHFSCMVDMFGRGGYLAEAKELVEENWGNSVSETLVGACSVHVETEIGMCSGECLKNSDPFKDMGYVTLSNLYCASGRWKEAEMVRKAMAVQGVKKMPGCSWVEVNNYVTTFLAGNNSHTCMGDVNEILQLLDSQMRRDEDSNVRLDFRYIIK